MTKKGNYIQFGVSVHTREALRERNLEPGSISRTINDVAAGLTLRQVTWLLGTEDMVKDKSLPLKERFDTMWVTPTPEMQARATGLGLPATKLLRAAAIKLSRGSGRARRANTRSKEPSTRQPSAQ